MNKKPRQKLTAATLSEYDGVRYLHLGSPWVQGAMRIRAPAKLELEYIQRMMAWLLWLPSERLIEDGGRAVQLGLGAAAITRFTHQRLRWPTVAVELNPTVIAACRLWFHLGADDARLTVVQDDAARWMRHPYSAQCADALCVDLYDHEAAAPVLDDAAFYADCRAVLDDGGVMSVNLFGRDASFEDSAARIASAFGADQVWQLAPTAEGNTVVIATRGAALADRDVLAQRAAAIEARFKLPARKWLKLIRPWRDAA